MSLDTCKTCFDKHTKEEQGPECLMFFFVNSMRYTQRMWIVVRRLILSHVLLLITDGFVLGIVMFVVVLTSMSAFVNVFPL